MLHEEILKGDNILIHMSKQGISRKEKKDFDIGEEGNKTSLSI